jgi:anhydro-N-acetylmuramic acid kinase
MGGLSLRYASPIPIASEGAVAASPVRTAIGAISGTSMDGIDVAVLETDGHTVARAGPGRMVAYPPALRAELQAFLADPSRAEHDPLTALDRAVTDAFTGVIAKFMAAEAIEPSRVDLIGLHGQTVYHRPERRFTRQLGQGPRMADALGIDVVDGFRRADVASGGQGAPFAPLYHAALARGLAGPVMVLNLGGVGNVTYIDGDTIIAFDTGPASALIDDLVSRRCGVAFDEGGQIAERGVVDTNVLGELMANPFFAAPAPKSLDRNDFHTRARIVEPLADADAVATLAAFTIEAVVASRAQVPATPIRWLVTGGGRHNQFFMRHLRQRLCVPVEPVEAVGWNGDLIEAQCFGYLAVRATLGLPLSLPTTTGVPHPMPGGVLHRASPR